MHGYSDAFKQRKSLKLKCNAHTWIFIKNYYIKMYFLKKIISFLPLYEARVEQANKNSIYQIFYLFSKTNHLRPRIINVPVPKCEFFYSPIVWVLLQTN